MESKSSTVFMTGSRRFIIELMKKTFKNGLEVIQLLEPGLLTTKYLIENGFKYPIVLNSTEGLELALPPFENWSDLEEFVGANTDVEAIDVEKQHHVKYKFSSFLRYMNNPNKRRTLNLISLECSTNGLNNLIKPPNVARELDWTEQFWPADEEQCKPRVQKYCLISPKNSYTDFHIDFGGTSVWYHIVKGEKVFYIIRPSVTNISLYWKWSQTENRLCTFLGDQVNECYKCTLRAGQTLFLPSSWIHAVLTTEDSLVYGGNFLHSLSIEEQLSAHYLEKKYRTPMKYMFPNFEDLHWLVGKGLLAELEVMNRKHVVAPKYLVNGLKLLSYYLKQWMPIKRMFFKELSEADNLLEELNKQIQISETLKYLLNPPKSEEGSTGIRKRPVHEDCVDYSNLIKVKSPKKQLDSVEAVVDNVVSPVLNNAAAVVTDTFVYPSNDMLTYHQLVNCQIKYDGLQGIQHGNSTASNLSSSSTFSEIRMQESQLTEPAASSEDSNSRVIKNISTSNYNLQCERSTHPCKPNSVVVDNLSPRKCNNFYPEDPTIDLHVVYQDDDYIYPSLELTDEEDDDSFCAQEKGDEPWCPNAKVSNVLPKDDRPSRVGKQKVAVERGLKAAASTPLSPPKVTQQKKKKVIKPPAPRESNSNRLPKPTKDSQKPKKGFATTKQRLGKILKLQRYTH